MSRVSCVKVDQTIEDPNIVFVAVKKSLDLISWKKLLKPGTVVLKINAVWDRLYPGCTTTPMVIEGVLKVLLESKMFRPQDITIADTDTAALMNADRSFAIQGITRLAKRYKINLINLSNTRFKTVLTKGKVLKELKISKILLETDNIITMPVLKTHAYSQITGGLKNQWGCIHDLRHNYHLVLNEAISDVNLYFKNKLAFGLTDGLFGMEGQGPKNGTPIQVGCLLASSDLVSLDAAASKVMGFQPEKIKHLNYAATSGLGSLKYNLAGNMLPKFNFKPATNSNIVMKWEMRFRHFSPILEKILFHEKSPFLILLTRMAKIYYDLWYYFVGYKHTQKMMETNYGKMWTRTYLNQNKT